MASGFKHFSHKHDLMMHEMPEGAEVSCCGCNSLATKTIYVCWQCNFYLHEQCFQATRSRKHPSHPQHPLTLVPYPTYPSNSFYCNSCKIIGTGFSYSCSDCDFDLHVQCAYSISSATNFHQPHAVTTSPHDPHHHISYPIPTLNPVPIQYPINITQDSYMAQNVSTYSVPSSTQNPVTSVQNAHISQTFTSVPTSAHNSSIPQNTSFAFVPTSAPNPQPSRYGESGQNKTQNPGIKHFSHPHGLVLVNIKHGKKNVFCSGCQEPIIGKGYACVEANCGFQLHESCFNLKNEIQHKSHSPHPLILLSTSPYKNTNGKFTCNACFKDGTGFNYHCSICEHDLHVKCANLKETVKREDHEHVLKLCYECPLMGEEYTFFCDVCSRVVHRDHWTYYCKECDFGTHLDCVESEVVDEASEDHVVDGRSDQQRLKEAMEVARISAIGRKNMLDNI
ncbi:hypothetical protein QVD17_20260 [Tagetes erecta]|uniref:DC1 domain-containing protein n=1 Tax=Tagetes erecta TaxID=13708 RepID=A0AAD8KKY2_TARER|nr:hypothetical protein QVD17_20260 [Tagetes erecta]